MMREMPCGKEKVVRYKNPRYEVAKFISRLKAFGFTEVDIEIPKKAVDQVRRNAAVFLHQTDPR